LFVGVVWLFVGVVWLFALVLLLTVDVLLAVLFALLLFALGSGSSPHATKPTMARLSAPARHLKRFFAFIITRSESPTQQAP
jgi:hypothetical protein